MLCNMFHVWDFVLFYFYFKTKARVTQTGLELILLPLFQSLVLALQVFTTLSSSGICLKFTHC